MSSCWIWWRTSNPFLKCSWFIPKMSMQRMLQVILLHPFISINSIWWPWLEVYCRFLIINFHFRFDMWTKLVHNSFAAMWVWLQSGRITLTNPYSKFFPKISPSLSTVGENSSKILTRMSNFLYKVTMWRASTVTREVLYRTPHHLFYAGDSL